MRIGILALQGGVVEHARMLGALGVQVRSVRLPGDLEDIDGLILPGGESTAIVRLVDRWSLAGPLSRLVSGGLPTWGTCAGAILLASRVGERDHEITQHCLSLARVGAVRNAFGRQVHSFQEDLSIDGLESPFPGVFIRAPLLEPLSPEVEVLARVGEGAVFLRDRGVWLTSFHPELTGDDRVHRMFLSSVRGRDTG